MDDFSIFRPGKLTTVLDASAGSSGKGKLGAFICENAESETWSFCCNTFYPQAGHWVKQGDKSYFYQTLNSCAYMDRYQKMYIGPGAIIELPALFREIEESNVDPKKLGINPIVAILQDKDAAFERGEVDFDGNPVERHDGTMKRGSTCHGVGACRARKILRRQDLQLAQDIPELKEFLCDTTEEILRRLERGGSGLLEVAQGFQLSYGLKDMYPYCTSRNCTVAAGFDDMMLPLRYAGPVILNCRTYPIRINNKKYIGKSGEHEGKHLTWDEIQAGVEYEEYIGNSGPGYDDQEEISWDEISKGSGSPDEIIELTSVTKLPRRAFTFSKKNLVQAAKYNDAGHGVFISVNFANYVDYEMTGRKGRSPYVPLGDGTCLTFSEERKIGNIGAPTIQISKMSPRMNWRDSWSDPEPIPEQITDKFGQWIRDNIAPVYLKTGARLMFIGTGPNTDEMITL